MLCELVLALLIDSSASVNADNWRLLREGHAAAFRDPGVHRAIRSRGSIAVRLYEFSDYAYAHTGWTILRTAEESNNFSQRVLEIERRQMGGTATGDALATVLDDLANAPCPHGELVVDVATDGPENQGRPVRTERERAEREGVRINVLAIHTAEGDPVPFARDVLATADGFVIVVESWEDVPRAIIRKITTEIAQHFE